MNPDELAAQALANLETESGSALAAIRQRSAEAKSRLKGAIDELRAQAEPDSFVEESGTSGGAWELDSSFSTSAEIPSAVADEGALNEAPFDADTFDDVDLVAPLNDDFNVASGDGVVER